VLPRVVGLPPDDFIKQISLGSAMQCRRVAPVSAPGHAQKGMTRLFTVTNMG